MNLFKKQKPNVGIICDLSYERHHLFKSYYYSILNIFGNVRIIKGISDLVEITHLVIGDDHYGIHKQVWMNDNFISFCNDNKIKVIALTNEKIINSFFPWNEDNLKYLKKFRYLYHYTNDVDDCLQLGTKLNRTAPSKFFEPMFPRGNEKRNMIVFIGKLDCPKKSYNQRKNELDILKKNIRIDIYDSKIPKWEDYLKIISKYRFVYSPIGNGNFFPMRFYEALAVGAIPIHQVKKDTLKLYNIEASMQDCIFFEDVNEVVKKVKECELPCSINTYWMEDNLIEQFTKDKLI